MLAFKANAEDDMATLKRGDWDQQPQKLTQLSLKFGAS